MKNIRLIFSYFIFIVSCMCCTALTITSSAAESHLLAKINSSEFDSDKLEKVIKKALTINSNTVFTVKYSDDALGKIVVNKLTNSNVDSTKIVEIKQDNNSNSVEISVSAN